MSELNEGVNVTVDDATVITVPLVTTFTATNAAPTAKAVGDALADKVDTESIMESVRITWNGIESDNQGVILADADDLPVEDGGDSVKDVLDAHGESIDGMTEDIAEINEAITQVTATAEQALAAAEVRIVVVNISNLTGLPQTITDTRITADMVVVRSELSNPVAQLCDWTVTAANGSLTISKAGQNTGIGYGGTDLTLYLEKTGSETAQTSTLKYGVNAPTAGWYYTRSFSQSDEDSIFTSIVTTGSIRVHRSGSFISVRLLEFVPAAELTAGTTYTIATLPENCRLMLMMQGNFVSSNGQYRGILAVQAGAGTVAITPTGSNIPAGTSLIVYMPIYNMARDHDDQDLTGYVLTTPTGS